MNQQPRGAAGAGGAWTLLLLLMASPPDHLLAQTQAQRILIEAFRDSLDRVPDSTSLLRLDTRMVQGAQRARPDPFEHLRMGFLALRLGDLGRGRGYDDAAMEFQTVTRLAPRWPYAWYGLGLAEYATGRVGTGPGPRGEPENPVRTYARAVTALAKSASADPVFVGTLVEEAYVGRLQRDPSRSTVAVAALRLASEGRDRTPSLLLGLGRVEREFGDPHQALVAFDALLKLSVRNRGLPLLEIARTRFLLDRPDGEAPYYEGAALDDSATVEAYRLDLAVIASDAELAQFDATKGRERVSFLRRFWGSRDAAELRQPGERLREHYRRIYFARRSFPSYVPTRWRDLTRRVAIADQVDDRGLVYMRQGEPDDRASLNTAGFEPNESWRYNRPEGELVLHFVARQAPDDFHMVESLFDVGEPRTGGDGAGSVARPEGATQLLRSRESLSSFYRTGRADPAHNFRVAERALSRASMRIATTTDSYIRRYARSLGAHSDLVLLGAAPSGRLAQVALAVPFSSTGSAWIGGGLTFPIRLRLVGVDLKGTTVVSLDTVVRAEAVSYHEARWLAAVVSLPLPEGRLRVRLAVEDDDQAEGTVFPSRSLEVAGTAAALAISDLAIGEADGPWSVSLPSGRVFFNPVGGLDRETPTELRFEAYPGSGSTLTCQLTVIRTDEQPGVVLNASWNEGTVKATRLIRYRLEPGRLRPGYYRAEVTVRDERGGLVRRWREFQVVP